MTSPPPLAPQATPRPQIPVLFVCLGNICSSSPSSQASFIPPSFKPLANTPLSLSRKGRSPMAEAVFSSLISSTSPSSGDPTFVSDSAGTAAYHAGDPPDPRTLRVLKQNGITGYMHEARKVRQEDFWRFDWILGMDNDNVEDLLLLRKKALAKKVRKGNPGREEDGSNGEDGDEKGRVAEVRLYGDFGGRKGEEVVDPYYGGGEGFGIAFEQMGRFGRGFLEFCGRGGER